MEYNLPSGDIVMLRSVYTSKQRNLMQGNLHDFLNA